MKNYEIPSIEIISLEVEDVITTSYEADIPFWEDLQ